MSAITKDEMGKTALLPENFFKLKRFFSRSGKNPLDEIIWIKRDAIVGSGNKKVFEQKEVEFPDFWSANAVNITSSKYFRGRLGTREREVSLRQMIERVVKNIRRFGEELGYFKTVEQADTFENELSHILVHQKGSFNSPVWFNVGTMPHPQCSACFILSVKDDMSSILDWIKTEGMIFKGGSGSGINLSALRSKNESLSAGGKASGPVSFMRGADAVAGMVILNIDHPDVVEFINCKVEEEKKIHALSESDYDMADLNNEAWYSIQFQNANNSVRLTDEFMEAVEAGGEWSTKFIKNKEIAKTYKAEELLRGIAEAAWQCGDPGVQFDTTINHWHTCSNTGRINASNPCSEYMHLDDSACNLASINLMKFLSEDGNFKIDEFKHTVDIFILAQEILVQSSSYPTEKITANAKKFRELGLGYANLGAFLMAKGFAYDSKEGRAWASAITSLMSGEAYRFSAEIASGKGPFDGFQENKEPMLKVVKMHEDASEKIDFDSLSDKNLSFETVNVWKEALALGEEFGFRNSQVSVLAPTGTISFMMDCDTTGVEPDFSLVKTKQLVGGGWMKIVNQSIEKSLRALNYLEEESKAILSWIYENGTAEGAPFLKENHLPIFDCAVKTGKGTRSISWRGHIKMVAAVQPFISGAISKTFNMAHETTVEEIEEAFIVAWKLGVKAFAVYRDGSKATQPLYTGDSKGEKKEKSSKDGIHPNVPYRRRLPPTRPSETHKFSIAGHEGYLIYSMYEDGACAEIFIEMAKQGSTLSGLLDAFAITISMALQYGVPLKNLADKFIYSRFEPAGFTTNPDIKIATSIVDYIFRYLSLRFLSPLELKGVGAFSLLNGNGNGSNGNGNYKNVNGANEINEKNNTAVLENNNANNENSNHYFVDSKHSAGTVCKKCGGMMVRTGTCMTCLSCGESSGGCS